jgi:hypothetical protein
VGHQHKQYKDTRIAPPPILCPPQNPRRVNKVTDSEGRTRVRTDDTRMHTLHALVIHYGYHTTGMLILHPVLPVLPPTERPPHVHRAVSRRWGLKRWGTVRVFDRTHALLPCT